MKIFVAGPRAIRKFDENIEEKMANIIKRNLTLLVGDAAGVDKLIQQFMHRNSYENVNVYATQGKARNNVGKWKIEKVVVEDNVKGFDFYAAKDIKMAVDADCGFMIWNGKSKGTLNNIINLTNLGKKVQIYLTPRKKFYVINSIEEARAIASACGDDIAILFDALNKEKNQAENKRKLNQIVMF